MTYLSNFSDSNFATKTAEQEKWHYNNNSSAFVSRQNFPKFVESFKYGYYTYNLLMGKEFKFLEAANIEKEIFDFFDLITGLDDVAFQKEAIAKFDIFDRLDHDNKQLVYAHGEALARILAEHEFGKKGTMMSIAAQIQQKYDEKTINSAQKQFNRLSPEALQIEEFLIIRKNLIKKTSFNKNSLWRKSLKWFLIAAATSFVGYGIFKGVTALNNFNGFEPPSVPVTPTPRNLKTYETNLIEKYADFKETVNLCQKIEEQNDCIRCDQYFERHDYKYDNQYMWNQALYECNVDNCNLGLGRMTSMANCDYLMSAYHKNKLRKEREEKLKPRQVKGLHETMRDFYNF